MSKKEHNTVTTPMGEGYGKGGANPSGKVCTDGKMTNVPVPTRDMGPNSIPEVTLDENMGIPSRSK